MRRKPLRAVMLAGSLFAAGGTLLHQPLLGSSRPLASLASAMGAMLAAVRQWIQLALAHTSPVHIIVGVAVAWFIFVLALLFLTPTDRVSPGEECDADNAIRVALAESMQARGTPTRRSLVNTPVPHVTAPLGLNNGHLLALIGIAATERQRLPYGLFLVAEIMGARSEHGEASQRTIDVITSQIAPLLGNDRAWASEHLSALFEMAVRRTTHVLQYNDIRTTADLRALAAGIMVMGNNVYVVSVGHCRVYLFRPSTGLVHMTMDFLSCECRLLPPAALDWRAGRDQIYRSIWGNQMVRLRRLGRHNRTRRPLV